MNRLNAAVFIVIAAALLCPPAAAQPNSNQRAEAEARRMLPKCQQPTRDLQQLCLRNQRGFIWEYVRAMAGSDINIRGVSSYLRPLSPTDTDSVRRQAIGLPVNLFESCAWLVWYSLMPPNQVERSMPPASFNDAMRNKSRFPDSRCDQLSPDEEILARRRGEQLMQQFLAAPAVMPPFDWQPKIAGLVEPKPGPPIPERCMLTVAPPLNAAPGWRQPGLPADCP